MLREILEVMDFWLEMGVDGVSLHAIPYLVEREGTSCEAERMSSRAVAPRRRYFETVVDQAAADEAARAGVMKRVLFQNASLRQLLRSQSLPCRTGPLLVVDPEAFGPSRLG